MIRIMFDFKVRYCKARMLAYIRGELPPRSRRRMARYLDECPRCYQEYQRQRSTMLELERTLPAFGAASGEQLGRIWTRVQADMQRRPGGLRPIIYHASYGLAALMLLVILMLPLAGTGGSAAAAPLMQPEPVLRLVASTTLTPGSPALSATRSAPVTVRGGQTSSVPETVPPNTPRPLNVTGE